MTNPEEIQTRSTTGQVIDGVVDTEPKPANTGAPQIVLEEKAEKQPISYRRSRNVALMKLALLRQQETSPA
jgi:hypothetical protein